jgi:hypothetical protein
VKPRVYIAGPMTGLPEWNFPAFHKAAARWREAGWDVVNPAECFNGDTSLPYREYVKEDIKALATCQAVAMLEGWDGPNARGSVWEREIALTLGLVVYDADYPLPAEVYKEFHREVDRATKPTNPKDAIGSNKLPLHLWPTTATAMGCLGLLDGELKYGRSNFRKIGIRASIYYDAARRHLDAWFEGEDYAPDNGIPHLAHALACLAIIVDAEAAGKLNDDRMLPGGYRPLVEKLTPLVKQLKELHKERTPKHYTIADARGEG